MGFLDFLTKPRMSATPRDPMTVTPYEQPQAEPLDGLLSAVPERLGMGAPEQLQQMPQLEQKPSLLSGAVDFAKSPQFLAALGAGIKGMGGDSSGVQMAWNIGERDRAVAAEETKKAEAEREKAEAQADLARRNAAFRGAYKDGRFDPQAYMVALGDQGDAAEAFSLARALAPKSGVDGGTAYTQDLLTGETRWGEQREESPAERLARERMEDMEAYREEQIRLREEALGLARQREGRVARGRPSGGRGGAGAGVPPPPGGYRIITPGGP